MPRVAGDEGGLSVAVGHGHAPQSFIPPSTDDFLAVAGLHNIHGLNGCAET
jgi:hypothetical protein